MARSHSPPAPIRSNSGSRNQRPQPPREANSAARQGSRTKTGSTVQGKEQGNQRVGQGKAKAEGKTHGPVRECRVASRRGGDGHGRRRPTAAAAVKGFRSPATVGATPHRRCSGGGAEKGGGERERASERDVVGWVGARVRGFLSFCIVVEAERKRGEGGGLWLLD